VSDFGGLEKGSHLLIQYGGTLRGSDVLGQADIRMPDGSGLHGWLDLSVPGEIRLTVKPGPPGNVLVIR